MKLLFGYGYLGSRIAKLWLDQGHRVAVVSRSSAKCDRLRQKGYEAICADIASQQSLDHFPEAISVVFAVGFDRPSDQSIHEVYVGGITNVLRSLSDRLKRLVYISTTGVYGDADGEWVDERTATCPTRPGGIASLEAEQLIRTSPFADRSATLRLAGIYGPDRLPYLEKLRAGEPIEASADGYLNLIHVDDAARVAVDVADPNFAFDGPENWCVSDGHPVAREQYYSQVAKQLDAPPPKFIPPAMGSSRAARAASNKRVSNRKLLGSLSQPLLYPTYRDGIKQILTRE